MGILIIMKLIADLHIHSRYSRATSPLLTPPWLERWARIKGIGLLGTGDCTHPLWLQELRSQLEDAEEGFYVLKKGERDAFNAALTAEGLPLPEAEIPRFVLSGEVSTIYKKDGKTRKVHHVIVLPDFKAAAAFNARLEGMGGNIRSDGRPILGIDSRDLLALLLAADERSLLIPAHIWTPWFSVLGEKSGFDSIEECYGDLAAHVPAVETGLSSNPPMNWALQGLDAYSIISSSDAHSPEKLGREATIFDMELSYSSLRQALFLQPHPPASGAPSAIRGTLEFFPQEGKYHYDGHRTCGVSLGPEEAAQAQYLCPACGKALTRGVMGRVLEMASRPVNEEEPCPPDYIGTNRRPYYSLISLKEIAAELLGTGTASKKAHAVYCRLIEKGGTEFSILMDKSREDLEGLKIPELSAELLTAAILNMRAGKVSVSPGYDGEYGKVRVFSSGSAPRANGEANLFAELEPAEAEPAEKPAKKLTPNELVPERTTGSLRKTNSCGLRPHKRESPMNNPPAFTPDPEQEKAISHNGKEAIIIAGPGTGKTRVLTERIARIIKEGADPASVLALTFTVKAAAELRERIDKLCGKAAVTAATFHSFCCSVLRGHAPAGFRIIGEEERNSLLRQIGGKKERRLGAYIEERKRFLLLPGEGFPKVALQPACGLSEIPAMDAELDALYAKYRQALKKSSCLDFEDLCAGTVRLLASRHETLEHYRRRFRCIFVDEYQDVNFPQYLLIRLLVPGGSSGIGSSLIDSPLIDSPLIDSPSLCVIGDPNQAIYGFRGSDKRFIDRFLSDYPGANVFKLSRSFRCAEPIISAAGALTGTSISGSPRPADVSLFRTQYATEKSEAEGIARSIGSLLGGTSFFALDSGVAGDASSGNGSLAPEDCAVLVRTAALALPIVKALKDHGIPFELSAAPWWKEEPAAALLDLLRTREKDFSSLAANPNPGDVIRSAWEELAKGGKHKKNVPETVERLIALAGFFVDISALIDTLDSCAVSGVPEPQLMAGVKVMTIHASKGLEFEHVFVAALEEGILPLTLFDKPGGDGGSCRNIDLIEEERRLLYVAMTRARRGLWLSWAQSRLYPKSTLAHPGRKLTGAPSRFLSELEKIIPLARQEGAQKWDGQLALFRSPEK